MEAFFILVSAAFLFAIIVLLVFGGIFFHIACSRNSKVVSQLITNGSNKLLEGYTDDIKRGQSCLESHQSREVSIKSKDGLTLFGKFIEGDNPNRTIICVHGYHGSPSHDFSIAIEALLTHGNLLMIDQRAHGKSEGKYITFGVRECDDCKLWADFVSQMMGDNHPIYFDGVSMGATTVLMASDLELPKNVKGIIADCSFTSPHEIVSTISQRIFKSEPKLLIGCIELYCRLFAGFSLKEKSTTSALKNNKRPILFAHGTGDTLVPHNMSQKAYDVCTAPKSLILAKDAEHGLSYLFENERYSNAITNLFKECEKTA